MLKTDVFGNVDLKDDGVGTNPREEALFRDNPTLKAAVEQGQLRVSVNGSRTSIELVSRRFAKSLRVPINLEEPQEHEGHIDLLAAQMKVIEAQMEKYPLLKQAIEDGWCVVKHDLQHGLHLHFAHKPGQPIPIRTGAVEKLAKLDGLGELEKHVSGEEWFGSTAASGCARRDDEDLSNSVGF